MRLPFTSNSSTASSSRSVSPAPSMTARKAPYQLPPRSLTTPLPSRPPSTDVVVSQDSAFPTFPIPKSRGSRPATPSDSQFPSSVKNTNLPSQSLHTPTQSGGTRINNRGNMLKRMQSIAPGPFNVRNDQDGRRLWGHRKSSSMSSSKDFTRPTSSTTVRSHVREPSGSSSVYTRNRSTSTVSGISRYDWDAMNVPVMPSISKEHDSKPQNTEGALQGGQQDRFDFGQLEQPTHSQTLPPDEQHAPQHEQDTASSNPTQTSPYSHKPRPSVVAAMQPLDSIGSSSSFKPSRSFRGRKVSLSVNTQTSQRGEGPNSRDDRRLQDAPPVPASYPNASQEAESPNHTPHESTSSNGSYSSGARSGSSRSSPPLQESPQRRRRESSDRGESENTFNDFKFGVESPIDPEMPGALREGYRTEILENSDQHPPRPPSESTQLTAPDIEPLEPSHMPSTSPLTSPDEYVVSSYESASHTDNLRISSVRPHPSTPVSPSRLPHRPRPLDKGPCRGCGELIRGKSISSADGRLTGKYHKGCFVCKTCNNAFQTVDFYVIQNHPYCGRHYHELNNSLCQGCDRGIEGQYLETEMRRKFHSYCFTCQDCHRILRDDYYEWNGRTLCEQHAFKAAQQPSSALGIGGGRRYPERRTTKLMMMM